MSKWHYENRPTKPGYKHVFVRERTMRDEKHLEEVLDWCIDHFGVEGDWVWFQGLEMRIKDPRQAFEFRMRWC